MTWTDVAVLVGLGLNLIAVAALLFKWGVWKGKIDQQLESIVARLGCFESLPERVSKLEGWKEGVEHTKGGC